MLPCLPYDFTNQSGVEAIVQVVRTIVEVSPSSTLVSLVKDVKESISETQWLSRGSPESSQLSNLLQDSGSSS